MTPACSNNCVVPVSFPRSIDNRPSLSRIAFRIGMYADFRQELLSELDRTPLLLPWTHRQPDDPGIALLEGVAILCDIVSFYTELYANEAWLRTATWPESVAALVRLLGYRSAPGIGGISSAAFEFKGATSVTVPSGFGFNAQIVGQTTPVDFETTDSLTAIPQLSRFSLYAPASAAPIGSNTQVISVPTSALANANVTLKAKDRLALLDPATVANPQPVNWQIGVINSVTVVLDQTVITLTGSWQGNPPSGGTLMAYKLGRSFHAFGYNAPTNQISVSQAAGSSTPTISTKTVTTTMLVSDILSAFPLERKVDDLSTGALMLVDLWVTPDPGGLNVGFLGGGISFESVATRGLLVQSAVEFQASNAPAANRTFFNSASLARQGISDINAILYLFPHEFLLPATITGSYLGADSVGPLSSSITWVEFTNNTTYSGTADRRTAQVMEVIGQPFAVTGQQVAATGGSSVAQLVYYGDGGSYAQLDGRPLQFVRLNSDDSVAVIEQTTATIDPSYQSGDLSVALRNVYLSPALEEFSLGDFPLTSPGVIVFGNVAAVTQGKTQPQAVLGNGDARQINQTFQIPKGPLTWLTDETLTPPRAPQIQLLVNNIEWNPVDTLFTAEPTDTSYIIRLDSSNNSWVQTGDGINGARLPSGVGNVVVTNRTGVGANGSRVQGTNPAPASQAQNLTAIRLYQPVTGGAAPESGDSARQAAPGRVQSLGRLVSLSDFEYEALALPNVEKASAAWDLSDGGMPLLTLTVLLANPSDAATASVQQSMSAANVARGPGRFQVQVIPASLAYMYVALTFGLAPGYQQTDVLADIDTALGVIPDSGPAPTGGLFSVDQRQLGEPEYASRVEAVVQNVDGVAWVEVTAFHPVLPVDPPGRHEFEYIILRQAQVSCASNQVLALDAVHFNGSVSTSGTTGAGS